MVELLCQRGEYRCCCVRDAEEARDGCDGWRGLSA